MLDMEVSQQRGPEGIVGVYRGHTGIRGVPVRDYAGVILKGSHIKLFSPNPAP